MSPFNTEKIGADVIAIDVDPFLSLDTGDLQDRGHQIHTRHKIVLYRLSGYRKLLLE